MESASALDVGPGTARPVFRRALKRPQTGGQAQVAQGAPLLLSTTARSSSFFILTLLTTVHSSVRAEVAPRSCVRRRRSLRARLNSQSQIRSLAPCSAPQ